MVAILEAMEAMELTEVQEVQVLPMIMGEPEIVQVAVAQDLTLVQRQSIREILYPDRLGEPGPDGLGRETFYGSALDNPVHTTIQPLAGWQRHTELNQTAIEVGVATHHSPHPGLV